MEKYNDITFSCPVTATLTVIGGKWKPVILFMLSQGTKRFGELKKYMRDVTQKMLTQQLRELEKDGIVHRKVYAEVPPRVEYTLTDKGETLKPILKSMCDWGNEHVLNRGGQICKQSFEKEPAIHCDVTKEEP